MKEERPFNPSGETTRAQNIAAIVVTVLFLGGVIGGGIALRRHSTRERSSTQGATGTQMQTGTGKATSGTVVQKVNDLTVTVDAKSGLRLAENDVLIEFRKDNELADVGTVKFSLDMNMPGMVMHDAAKVSATCT